MAHTSSESAVQELVEQIRNAFAGVPYPGDDDLTGSRYGEEPEALVTAFRGKTDWSALDSAFLDQAPAGWGSALAFFSGAALRFYLPAYMIADLRGELDTADPVGRLCLAVTPQVDGREIAAVHGGGTMGEHARRDFAPFNGAQVAAIVAYLQWRSAHEDCDPTIDQALEAYWLPRASA